MKYYLIKWMYIYIHGRDVHFCSLGTRPKSLQRGILEVDNEPWKPVTCKVGIGFF